MHFSFCRKSGTGPDLLAFWLSQCWSRSPLPSQLPPASRGVRRVPATLEAKLPHPETWIKLYFSIERIDIDYDAGLYRAQVET